MGQTQPLQAQHLDQDWKLRPRKEQVDLHHVLANPGNTLMENIHLAKNLVTSGEGARSDKM